MASQNMRDIDLLLIGTTGNGKSRTGNSILRRKIFKVNPSATSLSQKAAGDWSRYNGRVIKVVDTPGLGHTRMNNENEKKLVIDAMKEAIAMNPLGYHAFLLVTPIIKRFTTEDVKTIEFLKTIFGKDFVRKYCILVLTHGDNFEDISEETGFKTFSEWCKAQDNTFLKTLYDECEQRAVLFDNLSKDEKVQLDQLDTLINLIDSLWRPGHRYRDANFMKAAEARERVLVEAKEPQISEETMKEISLLLQEKEQIDLKPIEEQGEAFSELLIEADALFKNVKSQDKGTGALKKLLDTVDNFRKMLKKEITFCKRVIEVIAKLRQENQIQIERLKRRINELEMSFQTKDLEMVNPLVPSPIYNGKKFLSFGFWITCG